MQTFIPWIIALLSGLGFLVVGALWAWSRPSQASKQLPTEWALSARPVFSTDERRVYRLLREALPHHVVLSKLPLVRFCQPTEAKQVRYWFDLLGSIHVTFAICSPNGRVLAAVDLDTERNVTGRSLQIKQSVLAACRVRYLRCPIDNLPSAAELQLLVPYSSSTSRGPQPAPSPSAGPTRGGNSIGRSPRRAGRNALWQDSSVFHDSFFVPDSRYESMTGSDLPDHARSEMNSAFRHSRPFAEPLGADSQYPDEAPNDIVGVVVDSPRYRHR